MKLVLFALRRPLTVMVLIVAIALGAFLAVGNSVFDQLGLPYPAGLPKGMEVDIFPNLNLPVIYVCQPYGGMDPAQMEGLLTNYYEYHFLYISGIHHVESRNVQGMALMKLYFHPGTDMAQAMAETINYVNRSQAFMPPGTVSPFVMRFDTGSVPVGYLVLSSETRTIAEIQDQALFRVRPMFATLPGVSAPPPFGGSARTVVVTLDPQRLQSYGMSPDEVVTAVTRGNSISPSGNIPVGDKFPIVPVNSVVRDVERAGKHSDPHGRVTRLPPRRRHDPGRSRCASRLRPRQRPASGLHPGDEAVRRLDADCHQQHQEGDSQDEGRLGKRRRRNRRPLRVRPVAVCHAGRGGRGDRRAVGRRPRRADGAALPARLAERARRRAQHPAWL